MIGRLVSVVAAAVLLVAACGDSDGEGAGSGAGSGGDDAGPLAEYLGYGGDPEDAEAQGREQERQAQLTMQECMADEGFEYTPVDMAAQMTDPFAEAYELPPEEFVERYGFGFSTMFEEQQGAGVDFDPAVDDPNFARVEAMGEAEQQAYHEALYGEPTEFDETLSDDEQAEAMETYEPQGCQGRAYDDVYNAGGMNELYESGGLNEMYERYQSDPRVAEFWADWSACMSEEGHEYSTMDDLYQDLSTRMEPIWSSTGYATEGLSEEELEALSEEQLEELSSGPPSYDEAALAEVVEFELDLAAANQECGGPAPTEGEPDELQDIRFEYEQEFVDANREALEAVRSAREGG